MSDVTDATAPPGSGESDHPPSDAPDKAPSPETSEQEASGEGTETEAEGETETAEEVEIDFGGNKKRYPKGTPIEAIAAEVEQFNKGLWGDYTRKSQEVAEQRKAVEAEKAAVAVVAALSTEALSVYAEGTQLAREIEQLRQVDLQSLWRSNPDHARQISDEISRKSAEYERVVAKAGELGAKRSETERQEVARQIEAGRRVVAAKIPGFSDKTEAEIVDYATKTYGMSPEAAKNWPLNPAGAVMAWKAMQFDRLQAKAVPAAKPPPPPAAPVGAVKAGPSASAKDPAKMSTEEWMEWRTRNVARRRA